MIRCFCCFSLLFSVNFTAQTNRNAENWEGTRQEEQITQATTKPTSKKTSTQSTVITHNENKHTMSHLLITFVGKYMLSGSSSSSTSVDPSALQPFTVSLARLPLVIHRNPSEPCTVSASNLRNYSNYSNGATGDDDDSSDDDDDDNNSSNGRRKKDEWDHYSIHHHSIKQIECSYTESYVLMDDGTVFYVNFFRSSSDGDDDMSTERRKMPQLVMLHPLLFGGKRIEKLSGGYSRIFFLTVCGELYVQSDDNTYSQCGNHVARDFRGYSKVPNYDLAKCASSATVPAAYSSQEEGDDDASGCSTDMRALLSLSPSSPYAITHAACSYSFSTFVVNDKHLFGLGQNCMYTQERQTETDRQTQTHTKCIFGCGIPHRTIFSLLANTTTLTDNNNYTAISRTSRYTRTHTTHTQGYWSIHRRATRSTFLCRWRRVSTLRR